MKKDYSLLGYPHENSKYGHYKNKHPYLAARKFFTKLSKEINMNSVDKNFLVFSIIDNASNKIYTYQGTRVKLFEPIKYTRGEKEYIQHYKNIVTRYDPNLNSSK